MSDRMVMLDGPEDRIPAFSEVCTFCRHLRPMREGRTCDAFPERNSIPMAIWRGEVGHQTSFPSDHGIQLEPIAHNGGPERPAEEAQTR